MHDWRLDVVGHAALAELLVQNLLLEGTTVALDEAMQEAGRLYDCLACARQEALERNCEQGESDMKRSRKLKVCETGSRYSVYHYGTRHSVPLIRLQGKWLRQAGFVAGNQVAIIVENGKLTVLAIREDVSPVE